VRGSERKRGRFLCVCACVCVCVRARVSTRMCCPLMRTLRHHSVAPRRLRMPPPQRQFFDERLIAWSHLDLFFLACAVKKEKRQRNEVMARQFRKVIILARPNISTALVLHSTQSRELDLDSLCGIVSTRPPLSKTPHYQPLTDVSTCACAAYFRQVWSRARGAWWWTRWRPCCCCPGRRG